MHRRDAERLRLEGRRVIRALDRVRVVEQGSFITGSAAGMLLADMGADVVKVELPGTGDPFRAFNGGLYSPHFQTYNRNRRSITRDTRHSDDRAAFDHLISGADRYIQNFRPGFAEQLGRGEGQEPVGLLPQGVAQRRQPPIGSRWSRWGTPVEPTTHALVGGDRGTPARHR